MLKSKNGKSNFGPNFACYFVIKQPGLTLPGPNGEDNMPPGEPDKPPGDPRLRSVIAGREPLPWRVEVICGDDNL